MKNMDSDSESKGAEKLILRGIHLDLTEAMRSAFEEKAARLLRHDPNIDRIRIDLKGETLDGIRQFTATGRIEINGPDLLASETTDNAYKSVELLIDKLDRQIRKRMADLISRRTKDDIRDHAPTTDS